ncbi:siderophore-interacting protein [Pusillimonas sp.]|uniref:siderophore-interacting protein n=1 Tax=Pusillimonas sp. TaxID=3040095 RepID=UPI0037CA3DBA
MTQVDLTVQKLRHTIKLRRLKVGRITELTPSMRRITLVGDELEGFYSASFDDHAKLFFPAEPGAELILPTTGPNGMQYADDAPRPVMRDYTPRRYDPAKQELDIDFVLQHSGPATDWAAAASVGDELGVGGPRGSFVIPTGFDWHLLIGDETAMPAIGRRLEELPQGVQALVIVKTRDEASRIDFHAGCNLRTQWVSDDASAPADGMDPLERAVRALELPEGEGYIWAAGEYSPIQKVREHLVKERGIDKGRIRAASYWRKEAPATHVNFE